MRALVSIVTAALVSASFAAIRTTVRAGATELRELGDTGKKSSDGVDLSESDSARARKLYLTKCARCHKLYDPASYSDAAWKSWMEKMNRKAKLRREEAELLSRYIERELRSPKKSSP